MTTPQLPQSSSAWSQIANYTQANLGGNPPDQWGTTTRAGAQAAFNRAHPQPHAGPTPTNARQQLMQHRQARFGQGNVFANNRAALQAQQQQLNQARIAALPQQQQAQQLRLARAQANFVNQQNRQAQMAATAKHVRRVNIVRQLGSLASRSGAERAGNRIAALPTPAGIPLMLAILAFFVFAIMPVNGSYTRLGLLWLAVIGRVSLPGNDQTRPSAAQTEGAAVSSGVATAIVNAAQSAGSALAGGAFSSGVGGASGDGTRGLQLPLGLGGS